MNEHQILAIVRNHFKELKKLSRRLDHHPTAADVHDYRVEVKKLRAFLRLITAGEGEIKLSRKFKKYYDVIGAARNAEVASDQIYKLCVQDADLLPFKFLQALKKDIQEEQTTGQALEAVKIVKREGRRIFKKLPKKFTRSTAKKFVASKNAALASSVRSKTFTDDDLHEVRKIFKDLFYNWEYLSNAARKLLPSFLLATGKLKEFTDRLGTHQDIAVATQIILRTSRNSIAFKKEKKTLESLVNRLFFYKEVVKRPILDELKLAYP